MSPIEPRSLRAALEVARRQRETQKTGFSGNDSAGVCGHCSGRGTFAGRTCDVCGGSGRFPYAPDHDIEGNPRVPTVRGNRKKR
jgi:DnaJ-class molecular chaperone